MLMRRHGRPEALVADKLRSCGAALKEVGGEGQRVTDCREIKRAENSHPAFRRRGRATLRFRRRHSRQTFASVDSSVHHHFDSEHSRPSRHSYKQASTATLAEWRRLGPN